MSDKIFFDMLAKLNLLATANSKEIDCKTCIQLSHFERVKVALSEQYHPDSIELFLNKMELLLK